MNTSNYVIPDPLPYSELLPPLLETSVSISRFDEQLKIGLLREGFLSRLWYHEALACELAEGDLVHMEDLVLLDGRVFNGTPYGALSQALQTLRTWQRAAAADPAEVLRSLRPGEFMAAPDTAAGGSIGAAGQAGCDPERLEAWRRTCRQTEALPALLAAAIVWDAWLVLEPDPLGAWRGPLLAALVLKKRGATSQFLLPVDYGRRFAPYRRDPRDGFVTRIRGFLSWAESGVAQCAKDLRRLVTAEALLRRVTAGCRKSSKLPALVDLLLARPLVSVPLACRMLKVKKQSVLKMIPRLGSHVQEATGRSRYRVWSLNPSSSYLRQ